MRRLEAALRKAGCDLDIPMTAAPAVAPAARPIVPRPAMEPATPDLHLVETRPAPNALKAPKAERQAAATAEAWRPQTARDEPLAAEQYRRLAAALVGAQAEHGIKVVMVASAVQGEGKTMTAANLALTLARSYKRRVLLVDADLRLPSLHELFDVHPTCGLNDYLEGPMSGGVTPMEVFPGLMFVPAGRPSADPVGGLSSARMRTLIEEASAGFDFVILDTPPVALIPDGSLLSGIVDAVLLVVAAARTPYALLARAIEAIGRERILGTVLNGITDRDTVRWYRDYYAGY